MVTILPPPASVGARIGEGFQQGSQNATSLAQQLLPFLLNRQYAQNLFGGQGTQGAIGTSLPNGQQNSLSPQAIAQGQQQQQGVAKGVIPGQSSGFLRNPLSEQELDAYARNYALTTNNPQNYNVGYAQAQQRNEEIANNRSKIADMALKTGRIEPQYVPAFMQIAQRHGNLPTPEAIVSASLADFGQYKNLLKSLEDSFIPGFGTPVKQFLGKAGVPGLVPGNILTNLLEGGDTREKALKSLSGTARKLSDLGFEQDVRNFLSKESNHLSPTEVEEILHPLSKEESSRVSALPDAAKIPTDRREQRLQSFFGENLTPDTSLLVLRDKLLQKGYDWESIRDALEENRDNLTVSQEREMAYIVQPPIQSMSHIFRGIFNIGDVLRGQK